MSTKTTTTEKGIATLANDADIFGVDMKGRLHRFDAVTGELTVETLTGDTVAEYDLTEQKNGLPEWIDYVTESTGWLDHWEDVGMLEANQRRHVAVRQAREVPE